jgi:acetolactate synthase-1/2/3 large subunit
MGADPLVLPVKDLFYDSRHSHTNMINPDFVLLAKAMGVHAIRCGTHEELPAAMAEFLAYDGTKPILLECKVDRDEHVFPMVSPSSGLFGRIPSLMYRWWRLGSCWKSSP